MVAPIFRSLARIIVVLAVASSVASLESLHERVGQPCEEDAQPVGEEFVTARPSAEEVELGFLDPVFGFAS
jgi:hypothetical protein